MSFQCLRPDTDLLHNSHANALNVRANQLLKINHFLAKVHLQTDMAPHTLSSRNLE